MVSKISKTKSRRSKPRDSMLDQAEKEGRLLRGKKLEKWLQGVKEKAKAKKTRRKPKQHDPSKFPAGNAKIGDSVTLLWPATNCRRSGKIVKVGLLNGEGHNLEIGVKIEGCRSIQQVSCWGCGGYKTFIFPPPGEIPVEARKWARKNSLLVRRDPTNNAEANYTFVDAVTLEEVLAKETAVAFAEIRYRKDRGFFNGQWDVDESHIEIGAGNRDLPSPPGWEANDP